MGFMVKSKKVEPDKVTAYNPESEEKTNKFVTELGEWIPTVSYRMLRKAKGQ